MVLIRKAKQGDIPAILDIWGQSMQLHQQRDPVFTQGKDGRRRFKTFLEGRLHSGKSFVPLAAIRSNVVGYGIVVVQRPPAYFVATNHGLITDLDVHPHFRGRGIGQALLDSMVDWLGGRGIARVEAGIATTNEVSKGFWAKQGFKTYFETIYKPIVRTGPARRRDP